MNLFSLQSNSGRGETQVEIRSRGVDRWLLRVHVSATFWDRQNPEKAGELLQDYCLTLSQVVSGRAELSRLSDAIRSWLAQRELFELEVSCTDSQSFVLSLEMDDRFICSANKPILVGRYTSGPTLELTWGYVTDETCLQTALDELEEILADPV